MISLTARRRQLAASLASVIAGIALGWLASASRGEGGDSNKNSGDGGTASGRDRRHQGGGTGEAGPRHDFASYLKRIERWTTHPVALEAVARMSREELQAILQEIPEPDLRAKFSWDDFMRGKVQTSAAAELLRRDGVAAIDWAQAGGHRGAWAKLLQALAATDPAAAKEREAAYYAGAIRPSIWLGQSAVTGAATRSAAEAIDCLKLWKDVSFENIIEYAPGFDFGAVVAHLAATKDPHEFGSMAKHLFGAWAAADPDAAAAAMLRGVQDPGEIQFREWSETFGPALEGRAALVGEDSAAEWLAGILKQIPESRREGALNELTDRYLSTARAQGLIAHLEDKDRIAFAVVSEDTWGSMADHAPAVRVIQAMPSDELKMQALQAIAQRTVGQRRPENRAMNLKALESLMVKLDLSEAEMQKVFEGAGGGE